MFPAGHTLDVASRIGRIVVVVVGVTGAIAP